MTLGILGGLVPLQLHILWNADSDDKGRKDQDHLQMIIYNMPQTQTGQLISLENQKKIL